MNRFPRRGNRARRHGCCDTFTDRRFAEASRSYHLDSDQCSRSSTSAYRLMMANVRRTARTPERGRSFSFSGYFIRPKGPGLNSNLPFRAKMVSQPGASVCGGNRPIHVLRQTTREWQVDPCSSHSIDSDILLCDQTTELVTSTPDANSARPGCRPGQFT